jgi:hypothetical protein
MDQTLLENISQCLKDFGFLPTSQNGAVVLRYRGEPETRGSYTIVIDDNDVGDLYFVAHYLSFTDVNNETIDKDILERQKYSTRARFVRDREMEEYRIQAVENSQTIECDEIVLVIVEIKRFMRCRGRDSGR